jgi:hypothetical protein
MQIVRPMGVPPEAPRAAVSLSARGRSCPRARFHWRSLGESKTHNAGVAGSSPAPATAHEGAQPRAAYAVTEIARLLASALGLTWGTTRGTKGAPAGRSAGRSARLYVVRGDAR